MGRKLKMRDLERATGVGREAIRYYIREGLLPEPDRPARNVAWYDESFIERIALIKRLQNERYLPLSVIKGIVGGDELPPEDQILTLLDLSGELVPTTERATPHAPERLSRIARRVKLPVGEIRRLANAGAIEIATRDGDHWIEGPDVAVVETWARFRAAGYSDALDFSPEQIKLYVDFSQWLVREELRRFTTGVTGRADRATAQRMASEGIAIAGDMLRLIHESVMLRAIARGNVPAPADADDERDIVGR